MLPPVFELSLVGVTKPNVPDQESILLRPAEVVDLTEFGMLVGLRTANDAIVPLRDNFFWFGNLVVRPPSWLVVHTGRGSYRKTQHTETGEDVHHFYWDRRNTIFAEPDVIPVVFRIAAVTFGSLLEAPATPPPLPRK